jgi:hypothetical protein
VARKSKSNRRGGSIFKRTDGKAGWVAQLDLGEVDGKRKRRNFYGATRKEVQDRMQRAQEQRLTGIPVGLSRALAGSGLKYLQEVKQALSERAKNDRRLGEELISVGQLLLGEEKKSRRSSSK